MEVQGAEIGVLKGAIDDYISLTVIDRQKDTLHTDAIIQNWMRNRNTIELPGFWQLMYNPNFKPPNSWGVENMRG